MTPSCSPDHHSIAVVFHCWLQVFHNFLITVSPYYTRLPTGNTTNLDSSENMSQNVSDLSTIFLAQSFLILILTGRGSGLILTARHSKVVYGET